MADDRDLASILPEAPPPRPSGRNTAIEAALRRFDGDDRRQPHTGTATPVRRRWQSWPQISALATAALVVVVSASVWRLADKRGLPIPHIEGAAEVAPEPAAPAEAANAVAVDAAIVPEPSRPTAGEAVPAAPKPEVAETDSVSSAKVHPPVPELAAADQLNARASPVVTSPAPAPPPPPPAVAAAQPAPRGMEGGAGIADDSSIVVTGSLVSREKPARYVGPGPRARASDLRGDWNACTIDDPQQDLDACKQRLGTRDDAAAAFVADGLSRAWGGDFDGAIKAFDEAVRRDRKFSLAYLNRGLAFAREGDLRRGVADLTRAINAAPREARSYYHRSLLLARSGDAGNAQADALRALRLNPAYREIVR